MVVIEAEFLGLVDGLDDRHTVAGRHFAQHLLSLGDPDLWDAWVVVRAVAGQHLDPSVQVGVILRDIVDDLLVGIAVQSWDLIHVLVDSHDDGLVVGDGLQDAHDVVCL